MGTWRFHNVTTNADFWPVLDSISVTNQQPCELATFSGRIVGTDDLTEEDEVQVLYAADDVTFVKFFAGNISVLTLAHIEPIADPAVYEFSARDFTATLDDSGQGTLGNRNVTENADDRVAWIMGQGNDFGITLSGVTETTPVGPFDYTSMSHREALAQVAATVGAVFYVNFDKDLQFYDAESVIAAPFDLATPASPTTSYPYRDFRLPRDATDRADEVVAYGQDNIFAVATRVGAPAANLRKRRAITTDLTSLADLTNAAAIEVDRIGTPQIAGSLTCWQPGLSSGQTVHIVNPTHSIDDDFIISSISYSYRDTNPTAVGEPGGSVVISVSFSDRLLCIPRKDSSRSLTPTADCTDCTRTVTILPSGMDQNLSLAEGRDGMFVFNGTTLAKYGCDMSLNASATPAGHDLDYIDHEPVYEAVLNGDAALYTGTVGPFGDDRWSNGSEVVHAARVMDIREAWSVEIAADDWIVTLGTGAPMLECDGTDVVYTSNGVGVDTAEMKHVGPGPWSDGSWDLYITDIEFSAAHNNVQFLWYVGANDERLCALIYSAGAWSLEVEGTSTSNASAPSLSINTNYTVRWQHTPSVSRARIWASSGAEPGTWDVTRVSSGDTAASTDEFFQFFQNTTSAVVQKVSALTFDGVVYDSFNRTTSSPDVGAPDGGGAGGTAQLRRRAMTDGSLEAAVFLRYATFDIRVTPNRQHVMAILWDTDNGPFQRYSRTPATEGGEFSITGWATDLADWAIDDSYNVYKITTDGVLTRYDAAGSSVWSVDLNSLYGYLWPTRVAFGSAYANGQTVLVTGSQVYVCGYIGGAAWQTGGSQGTVLILDRADGSLISQKVQQTTGGNAAAQTLAMEFRGPCLWAAGAADGDAFEGQSISGVTGWIMKMPA
jgi:hypothetical protein